MKFILLFFIIFPLAAISQVYFPKLKSDTIRYKTDSASTTFLRGTKYDLYDIELTKWLPSGVWEARAYTLPGFVETKLYIPDSYFEKTYEYRKEIEKYSPKAKLENKAYLANLKKKYGAKYGYAIYHEIAEIGMTKSMFVKAKGYPDDSNTTRTGRNTYEQWIYYLDKARIKSEAYYFQNGILTAIQD